LKAIVAPTYSGETARLIAAHRPAVPVLALCPRADVVRHCALEWGVIAELYEAPHDTLELIEVCSKAAKRNGLAEPGERIGITAGLPAGQSGGTNLFKVHTVT
ncbi:MAG: pyruvate kinase alpha/beta domain-containing protein, partial [Thermoleophilaceae bacterium]